MWEVEAQHLQRKGFSTASASAAEGINTGSICSSGDFGSGTASAAPGVIFELGARDR